MYLISDNLVHIYNIISIGRLKKYYATKWTVICHNAPFFNFLIFKEKLFFIINISFYYENQTYFNIILWSANTKQHL